MLTARPAVAQLSDDDQRLLALAGSLATGQPVDLAAKAAVRATSTRRRSPRQW
ncbi:hypothetical protein [Micromonospora sp. WMMD964]|uniref:hypothetical protein n=1 Tax=Micromonospora sp. WMMD964 TaxID=3016091 RepID=UPI00249CAE80|nr:hypothetical protein [Micromonospora sp. WMMD964]WFF00199.1 hypothetical protein O7616_25395 [Micromonospora sp. WMMD964]